MGDDWDDWSPESAPEESVAVSDDEWTGFEAEPRQVGDSIAFLTAAAAKPSVPVAAAPTSPVLREHRADARAYWPSALLYVSLLAMLLAGLALYFALDRINVLDPGTIADAGLLLLATVLLSGVVVGCLTGAVVALLRRRSMWRASATIASSLLVAPAILYYAMVQGVDAMRQNTGRGVLGYVPGSASTLRDLAIESGVEAGWFITILEIVAGS